MPIYEYVCNGCGHEFEELLARHYDKAVCPRCGAEDTRRLLSPFATASGAGRGSPLPPAGGGCAPGG